MNEGEGTPPLPETDLRSDAARLRRLMEGQVAE
jgi:hypothetical protein